MKRETPRFSPSALEAAPPAKLRLCFPDCRPPAPQQDNRMDGRTDGQTAQALPGPAQGRGQGGQEGIWGSALGAPCPLPGQGPPWPPRGGCLGILFFSRPSPSARSPQGLFLPDGSPRVLGSTDPLQALAASPAGLGDATITSHSSPGPAPPAHRGRRAERRGGERRGEERRGRLRRGPRPSRPRFAPGPASAVAPAPRSLSLLPARSRGTL